MANAAVWRKMALIRPPVGCGRGHEYEAGTWLTGAQGFCFCVVIRLSRVLFLFLLTRGVLVRFDLSPWRMVPFEFRSGPF